MANTKSKRSTIQKPKLDTSTLSKQPPQAIELEEVVLGSMMLNKDAITKVIDILNVETFYTRKNQLIFEAIRDLFARSEPVDIITVIDELIKKGTLDEVGGAFYVTQLTSRVGSTANIEYHGRILSEKFILRELIRTSDEVMGAAYDETTDVFELLNKAEENLFKIAEDGLRKNGDSMSIVMQSVLKKIEVASKAEDGLTGVPSGFTDIDRLTSGWQSPDLIIIAARPGMGKTAFTLIMARNAAVEFKKPVAVFSLEMSALQLGTRLLSAETGISGDKLKSGNLTKDEWALAAEKSAVLAEAPIFIDDTPAINIFELRAKCRRLKMQNDIQMIVVDYLQLMSGSSDKKAGNREQEISSISRSLKGIAKELNIPVIALSQLSRAVETRGGDKRPMLSDLRESGAIEQDSDLVCFLYRPEYYGLDMDGDGNSTKGVAEFIVAKHRNGALGTVPLKFVAENAKFENAHNAYDSFVGDNPLSDLSDLVGIPTMEIDDFNETAPF